ncbi:MAG TPA: condensation domain-containing protein [Pyrinomonadaceae bacterium]|jgi:hypothetical protein
MSQLAETIGALSPKKRGLLEAWLKRKLSADVRPAITRYPRPADAQLPLSFAQQRLWFIDQLQPGSIFFNIRGGFRMEGQLDCAALAAALTEIVRRHEALRTTFTARDGQPFQLIAPAQEFQLPLVDLSKLDAAARDGELQRLLAEDARRPFDLARGPLLRATLIRLAAAEHVVLYALHHIVADGWSTPILMREVAVLYAAFAQGRPSPLPELPIQYADYAQWQHAWLTGAELERQLAYWRRQLADAPALMPLATDRPRPAAQTYRGAVRRQHLSAALSTAVRELCAREGTTPFMTLLAAFMVLLRRYSGQGDIVVGAPLANRNRVELEGLIGLLANPVSLRARLADDDSFRALLRQVREVTLGAYDHQELPFQQLVDELQLERSLSYHPLFQVSFTLEQSTAQGQAQELPGLRISPLELPSETVQLDLVLHMVDAGPTLFGDWQYSTDLFDAQTIAGFAADFELLLEQVVKQPAAPLAELLALLDEAAGERRRAREQELEAARLSKLKQVRRKAVTVPGAAESGASRHE